MVGFGTLGLERELLVLLDKVTPDDVYLNIEENKPWVIPPNVLQWTRPLYNKFRTALDQYTPDYCLERLRVKRPELYSVITTHPTGRQWLAEKLAEVRKQLET
jgi:hypothetical protein